MGIWRLGDLGGLEDLDTCMLGALEPHSREAPEGPADDGKRFPFSGSAGRFIKMSSAPMGEGVRGRGAGGIAPWPADIWPQSLHFYV